MREKERKKKGREKEKGGKTARSKIQRTDECLNWGWGAQEVPGFNRAHTVRKTDIVGDIVFNIFFLVYEIFFIGLRSLISMARENSL